MDSAYTIAEHIRLQGKSIRLATLPPQRFMVASEPVCAMSPQYSGLAGSHWEHSHAVVTVALLIGHASEYKTF